MVIVACFCSKLLTPPMEKLTFLLSIIPSFALKNGDVSPKCLILSWFFFWRRPELTRQEFCPCAHEGFAYAERAMPMVAAIPDICCRRSIPSPTFTNVPDITTIGHTMLRIFARLCTVWAAASGFLPVRLHRTTTPLRDHPPQVELTEQHARFPPPTRTARIQKSKKYSPHRREMRGEVRRTHLPD